MGESRVHEALRGAFHGDTPVDLRLCLMSPHCRHRLENLVELKVLSDELAPAFLTAHWEGGGQFEAYTVQLGECGTGSLPRV